MIKTSLKPYLPHILLLMIVLLGAALRIFEIGQKTVWLDEAFSIWIAHHNVWEIWQWLIQIDQHPPLYYMLLSFWQRAFGDLQGVVRTLSALFGTATILFLFAGTRRLLGRGIAMTAAFILAISPFHVNFAQETRMYALLTLVVAAAYYFLTVIMTSKPTVDRAGTVPRWAWSGFALSQAAVMLTHNTALVYFTVAVNLAIGLSWLATRQWAYSSSLPALGAANFGWRWLQVQGLALLLWLPWAYPFVIQAIGVDQRFWIGPPTWLSVHNTLKNFNFSFIPGWFPAETTLMFLYPLLGVMGIIRMRKTPARFWLLFVLFATPILLALLFSLRRPIYHDRTLIWSSLFYYVLIAAGIHQLGISVAYWMRRTGIGLWLSQRTGPLQVLRPEVALPILVLLMMSIINATALDGYYFWHQKEEWNAAADYVAENVGPDDLLLFNATWVQIPFEYYYRHHNLDTPMRGAPVNLFDRGELEPRMMESDIPYLYDIAKGQPRIWLVYSHDWYTDPNQIILDVLNQMMVQSEAREFVGLQVIKFDAR